MDGSAVIEGSIERWQKPELSDKNVTTLFLTHSVMKPSTSPTKLSADVFQSKENQKPTSMEEHVKRQQVAFASLTEDAMIVNGVGHSLMMIGTNQSRLCADVIHNDLHRKSEDYKQN